AVAAVVGDHDHAARVLGAADALDEEIYGTSDVPENPDGARVLAIAREHLGDERSLAAWTEGRAMTLDEAVEYALASIDSQA
ncbi:MAG TPA: hypothetical protein VFR32_10415, partial [Gaiellaceae bacterium]|nr:hypothetical protein [Gaiellaceae bacterium]